MRIYTVHIRPGDGPEIDPDQALVLVKEGFSWPAFFFAGFWALWKRLWLVAAGLFAAEIGLSLALALILTKAAAGGGIIPQVAATLGLSLLIGYGGNDFHRWTLGRRGYREQDVVSGADVAEAEAKTLAAYPELAAKISGGNGNGKEESAA